MPLPRDENYSGPHIFRRSEEHTSELQSRFELVCRLLLEKKKRRSLADDLWPSPHARANFGRLPGHSTDERRPRRNFFFVCYGDHRDLHSFPTRRSSDLRHDPGSDIVDQRDPGLRQNGWAKVGVADRKSTRLNSSHVSISYAVFCLKK